jgi:hypothetical protein
MGENESDFSRNLEGAPESRENGENFLRPRHTIYRGGGGHFQEWASIRPLRDLWRTRVDSDVPRVTFFTRVRWFSLKRIVGVNPLPRGASVRELGKTLSPRKVGLPKFRKQVHEAAL